MTTPPGPRCGGLKAVAAALLLAVVATACGGDPPAPATTAPSGYTVMSSAKDGYALAVPSDWTTIPLSDDPDKFDQEANRLRTANPKLASILNKARVLAQSGGKFMAVTPDGTGDVNLTVDKPKEKTLEEIVANSVAGLRNLSASNINQEPATLAGNPAVKVTFRLPVETDSGTVPTDEVQYYMLDGRKAYILTVAAASPEVASAIAASLRLR